jgi:hypothetical protein
MPNDMTSPSCRLFVIPARDAPTAVILRRGPSRWYHLILWDMERDAFTEGVWFRGRIYEEKCDLSPDGKLFVYFAYKGIRLVDSIVDSWTGVSRPPWLRALVVWPQGTTYGGGGRFVGNRRLAPRGIMGLDMPSPGHPPGLELVSTEMTPEVHRSTGAVPGSDWCGHDHRGRVIYTLGGRLFRRTGTGDVLVADFRDRHPKPEPPPEWASRWP